MDCCNDLDFESHEENEIMYRIFSLLKRLDSNFDLFVD